MPAGPAVAAGDRERDDDAVADLEVVHAAADLDDLAHELVPEDVALLHRRDVAVVEVQVGAADRGRRDPHDRVAVVEDLRVGDVLDLDGVASRPDVRPHRHTRLLELGLAQRLRGPLLELALGALALRRGVRARDLAGLDALLEPPQLVLDLGQRRGADELLHAAELAAGPESSSTWISVPRSPGASANETVASSSFRYAAVVGAVPEALDLFARAVHGDGCVGRHALPPLGPDASVGLTSSYARETWLSD